MWPCFWPRRARSGYPASASQSTVYSTGVCDNMREIRTAISIQAPPAVVWAHLTDLPRYATWNPLVREATGTVAPGARLQVRIQLPGKAPMTFTPTVTEVRPERAFRWRGKLFVRGLFDGEHIFEVEPEGDGSCRFVHRERFSGLLVPLLWRFLAAPTRAGFEEMNTALKARCGAG